MQIRNSFFHALSRKVKWYFLSEEDREILNNLSYRAKNFANEKKVEQVIHSAYQKILTSNQDTEKKR